MDLMDLMDCWSCAHPAVLHSSSEGMSCYGGEPGDLHFPCACLKTRQDVEAQ